MLKALAGPFPDVTFCPTGGITPANAPQFLALPNVRVCGGSWLTPADAVERGDWARITRLARAKRGACRGALTAAGSRRALQALLALDQLDLVAVGVGDERDHGRAALHRPGLARDRAAERAALLAHRSQVAATSGTPIAMWP